MGDVVLVSRAGFLVEDLQQATGGAGGGVDLVAVVHFRHLDVEAFLRQDLCGLAGQPEEGVDADREIRGVNDGQGLAGLADRGAFVIGVAGGADHQMGAVFQRGIEQFAGEFVDGEINDRVRLGDRGGEVFAGIVGGGDQHGGFLVGRLNDSLAHAAGLSGDEELDHRELRSGL